MNQPELAAAVAAYKQKSFIHWLKITFLAGISLASLILIAHLWQAFNYIKLSRHNQTLTYQIHELKQEQELAESQKRKFEAINKQYLLLCKNNNPRTYLSSIAEILPPETLLTGFKLTADTINLRGYSLDKKQYEEFISALSGIFNSIISVKANPEAAGFGFEISCMRN